MQNAGQYNNDFGESRRRWDIDSNWRMNTDTFGMELSAQQQRMAEWQAYTAAEMRAYAAEQVAAERERHADALRCALEALDYCIENSAELLNERTVQCGTYRKDRQAAMAATLERHRAVAERLRAMLRA